MTTAGDLRESIRLEAREDVEDEYGNVQGMWVTKLTAPARVRVLKGSETVMAGRLQGTQTAVISLRNQPLLATAQTGWRAVNARSGQTYNIRSVTPDERGAMVDLLVESGIPS